MITVWSVGGGAVWGGEVFLSLKYFKVSNIDDSVKIFKSTQ